MEIQQQVAYSKHLLVSKVQRVISSFLPLSLHNSDHIVENQGLLSLLETQLDDESRFCMFPSTDACRLESNYIVHTL